jgi:hypothetical protein
MLLPLDGDQVSHPYATTVKITAVLFIVIMIIIIIIIIIIV